MDEIDEIVLPLNSIVYVGVTWMLLGYQSIFSELWPLITMWYLWLQVRPKFTSIELPKWASSLVDSSFFFTLIFTLFCTSMVFRFAGFAIVEGFQRIIQLFTM
jgi:hypothetical protein